MRALTFQAPLDVRVRDVDEPTVTDADDVVVQVRLAGVCGSDLHPYHGRETGLDPGTPMGHEAVGVVVETGEDVRGVAVGDAVVVPFTSCCGVCVPCRRGLTSRCEVGALFGWIQDGVGLAGTQAEYVRVPHAGSTLVPAPADLPDPVALLVGDVLPTGCWSVDRALAADTRVDPPSPPGGAALAVVGLGPVGYAAVLAALDLGVERVLGVDPVPERRAAVAALGVAVADVGDAPDAARDLSDGRGVDAVCELVGAPDATRTALAVARVGATIAVGGVHTAAQFAFTPVEAYDRNLTYRTGRCPARAYAERALALARRRLDELSGLVTHVLPLEDGPEAYRLLAQRRDGCRKAALRP